MRRVEPEKIKRAVMVWITTLTMFAYPRLAFASWEPLVHRWWFLVFVPLVLAGCSLWVPLRGELSLEDAERERRAQFRKGMFALVSLVLIVTGGLILLNAIGPPTGDPGFLHRCNVAGSVALAILGGGVGFVVRREWKVRGSESRF
jgi:hypothetical protein